MPDHKLSPEELKKLEEQRAVHVRRLVVPENRAAPARDQVIQFKKAATTAERATIYLEGGPGGSGEGIVEYVNVLGKACT